MWLSSYFLPAGLGLVLLGIAFGSEPVTVLGVFIVGAGGLARLWSKHALDRVRYERLLPEDRTFQGETLAMTLRLTNDKMLPVPWIEIRDAVPENALPGEERLSPTGYPGYVYLSRSTHLRWYERVRWPLELRMPARGFYRLGPVRVSTGDLFGFFPVTREEETSESVIVYPRVYSLPELGLPAERPFGELKGRERIFEDPGRIAGIRDYRPGDPMRRIDWKASARRQQLQSRVYEPSATMHLLIALNVHTLGHSWEGFVPETLERLLSAAGSVARYAFDAGYAIGLIANGSFPDSDRPMRVPVGRRPDQLMRVLEALAVIHPMTLAPLEAVIDAEAQRFPFGATLVCVTSRMDAALAASLQRVAGAGHTVTVLSLADDDFEEDLGRIAVHRLTEAMIALESRAAAGDGALA